jgi:glucokinase
MAIDADMKTGVRNELPFNDRYAAGVDVGGSHVCCSVVDLQTVSIVEGSTVRRDVNNRAPASEVLAVWSDAVRRSVALARVQGGAAGFAIPGPFDYRRGVSTISGVDKFEGIFGLDVATSLRSRLRGGSDNGEIERFGFVNDASAFALGESMGGAARGATNAVVLTLGTGFGSGFVSRGRLVSEGERVPPNGWVYCLPFEGGIADDAFSTRWFCRRYRELTGQQLPGAREIAARADDTPEALLVFEEYGRRLAQFVAPVAGRFGADVIVLGGNIARAFALFAPAMNDTLAGLGCHTPVRPSTLGDLAAVTGAATLFL